MRMATCGLLLGSCVTWSSLAGPITPPPGPVASSYKTLTEVEPRIAINATNTPGDADSLFKITQPGSYYLTGNITGVANKHGIEIASSGVTLDLNGFDLVGVAGSFDGVSATVAGLTSIAVVNGSVRSWKSEGVDLGALGTSGCRVEGVRAYDNFGIGIYVGQGGLVLSCTANHNTNGGIIADGGSTITNCAAFENLAEGITTGEGCIVWGCSASSNSFGGYNLGQGTTITDCNARLNGFDGIAFSSQCVVRNNTCSNNGSADVAAGIHANGNDNRIEGNNCTGADRGIDAEFAAGNIIIRNTCSGNTIDWVIGANNVVGPILDRRAPASAAINGFAAPDSTGSTHPNANFSY